MADAVLFYGNGVSARGLRDDEFLDESEPDEYFHAGDFDGEDGYGGGEVGGCGDDV